MFDYELSSFALSYTVQLVTSRKSAATYICKCISCLHHLLSSHLIWCGIYDALEFLVRFSDPAVIRVQTSPSGNSILHRMKCNSTHVAGA
jgi:hypothetical protein